MVIRNMSETDLPHLAKLYEQFWGEKSDIEKMNAQFQRMKNSDAYILLCASEDNRLLGSVMGVVCNELYGDCKPFLVVEDMIVDKSVRRSGIGRALFAELERRARSAGCSQALLVTETDRQDACGFYESLGFDPDRNKGYKKKL